MIDFLPLVQGDLTIRPLSPTDADMQVMAKWLTDPRVLEYWDGRDNPSDVERVRSKYLPRIKEGDNTPCLVHWQGRPVGFVQFYPLGPEERTLYGYGAQQRVWATDQFLGEPDCWSQGLGTRLMRLMLQYLFTEQQADRVVLDPQVRNARAIRMYEKCGFRPISLMPGKELHEGEWRDCLHMAISAERFAALGGLHMNGRLELHSERLLLRPFTGEDWEAVHTYAGDPEVVKYQVWGPNTPEQTRDFVSQRVAEARKLEPDYYAYAICLKETGQLVGAIDLFMVNRAWKQAEIGFVLNRRHWGRGIVTEAAFLTLDFAFRRLDLQRVYATCDPENVGSYRVLEKVGMRREGLMRHDRLGRLGWRDSYLYAIIRRDWAGVEN